MVTKFEISNIRTYELNLTGIRLSIVPVLRNSKSANLER